MGIGGRAWFCALFALVVSTANPLRADTFQLGDFQTYDPFDWGNPGSGAGTLLFLQYANVYAPSSLNFEVGIPGPVGFSVTFDNSDHLTSYLPDGGPAAALDSDYLDPLATSSGQFGSNLITLKLNIDFADAGLLASAHGITFGDLIITGDNSGLPALGPAQNLDAAFYGLTVRQFLASANQALGGGVPFAGGFAQTAELLNTAFADARPSDTAQRQLAPPMAVPEPEGWLMMMFGFYALATRLRARRAPSRPTPQST